MNQCTKRCFESINYHNFENHQKRIKLSFQSEFPKREHQEEMKLRLQAALQNRVIRDTSQRIRLSFDETMDIDGVNISISLCESCFVHLNDVVCNKTFANWKKSMKKRMFQNAVQSNLHSSITNIRRYKDPTTNHYRNILEARKALGDLDLSETDIHLSCLPKGTRFLQAYYWLSNFFDLVGDRPPNRDNKVQLPGIYEKVNVYTMYRHHLIEKYNGDEHNVLSKSSFLRIWKNIYPNVTITKFCVVTGKCNSCHLLYNRKEYFRNQKQLEAIKYFSSIHKITIQLERGLYVKKRQLAQDFPHKYMSLIIDGMSQDHCELPYCANMVTKNHILKQKIMGAKQHGFRKSFYRTYPHICSGSNLACEVLLHEIHKRMLYCKTTNTVMPNILFLQIDGGPENTSRTFYGLITQLVMYKVFKRIDVSRLPVGHTHEDIDAMFGTLWKTSRQTTIITPQNWKQMAIRAFVKRGENFVNNYDDD